MTRNRLIAFLCGVVIVASAHVGSPNVVFDGNAGPYPVRVIVRPPNVVPGLAEVIVRLDAADVQHVVATPVFYRAGAVGAPRPDELKLVAGQTNLYSGTLWLMSRGSSSVYVTVSGARGSGTAIVPVASLATGRLSLSPALGAILVVLALVLFAGMVTIVRAASGEALLEPGQPTDSATRSRARTAGLIAVGVLAVLVLGGAKWWDDVDLEYQQFLYKPPRMWTGVEGRDDRTLILWFNIHDTAAFRTLIAPPIPDHGKLMHLFVVRQRSHDVFAHLHPIKVPDSLQFWTRTPGLPSGDYIAFADMVLENGMTVTTSSKFNVGSNYRFSQSDTDDSWSIVDRAAQLRPGATQPLDGGLSLVYTGDSSIAAKTPVDLKFEVRGGSGVVKLDPYLGMAAHAVVLRDDESVFIHLHPMGTVSTDAQRAFANRDSGRTHIMTDMPASYDGRFTFPYEFPKSGRYRMWVQVKADKHVLTGAFDVDVR